MFATIQVRFILAMIKEVEAQDINNHWTLMNKNEVKNRHRNKYGKLKIILFIWYFKRKRFPYGRLMKYKFRLCAHVEMQLPW